MAKEIINSPHAPEPIGPYSQAILANGVLYVSGQIAIERNSGHLVLTTIEEETRQVLRNIGYILEQAGMGFSDVIKCTIFLSDMGMFPRVNAVYGEYFSKAPPARETVQVSRLPKDVNVEISCIATK